MDVPTNEWTTVTFDISSAPGWGVDENYWWRSEAFQWAMQIGVDYETLGQRPELVGANMQFEFIEFSDSPVTDSDRDGMPDDWETANGLDPYDDGSVNPDNGANGDPDGDGATNIAEYRAGTDPQDPDSAPPKMPVAAGLGLLATAAAIIALRKRFV